MFERMDHSAPASAPGVQREAVLFAAALERPPAERAAFLDGACHGDPALRARLEALLAANAQPETLLDTATEAVAPAPGIRFAEAADEAVGQTLGRYKLLEKLGEGGCGVVYVAEQTEPVRRRVALKVIKLGMDTKAVVARFEAERQALAMMDHPNIAKVLDAGTTESSLSRRGRILDGDSPLPLCPMRVESEVFHMIGDTVPEPRQDRSDLIQSFAHPVPLDLKSVAVVDDVPEAAKWAELASQRLVKQQGQRRLFGRAEPLEQVQVPGRAGGQLDAMKAAQALENVLDARVELREEGRRGHLLADRGLTAGYVPPQGFEFIHDLLQRVELDRDLGFQLFGRHKSTRARFSIRRVKGVGGSSGTKSSGTPRVSSKADANSKSFQPGTPAQARSRSRAVAGCSSALPKSSSRLAPNCRATRTAFIRLFSKSVMVETVSLRLGTDNNRCSICLPAQP